MYLSGKYIILYVGAGVATGYISKGDRNAALIGLGISALIGASFGVSYALISALEFAIGLGLASMLIKKQDPEQ